MQRCKIWTVSLAAALSLTGAAWAEHEGGGGHGPAASHGTTPTFAKHRGSDEARESHSGAQNSEGHSAANFAARLANNPTLSARLQDLLTALISNKLASSTMDPTLQAAAKGFRNLGQFIAALHAATDQNISFDQLKADMTGPGHDSLGQAIQDLKPTTDPTTLKSEVTQARQEAQDDVQKARAAQDKAEDAKEAAKEKAEDAKEAAKEKAEDANEGHSAANFAARLAARVANDPTLATALKNLGVSDVATAAKGFRNLNQFLTALNAANDLKLDFAKLQTDIKGGDSLAQAILDQPQGKALDPTALKTAIMMARNETKAELKMVRAGDEAAEDAKEAAKEAAEDAKEATKEAAEDANEAAKAPTGTTATGSSPTPSSVTKP